MRANGARQSNEESVMGGCDDDNIRDALGCWNDVISLNVTNEFPSFAR